MWLSSLLPARDEFLKNFLFGHMLRPSVKLQPPAVGAHSLNHWTTSRVQDEFLDPKCLYALRNGIKNTSIIGALFFSTSSWVIITHSLLITILSNLLSLVTCQLKYSFALIWMNFLPFFLFKSNVNFYLNHLSFLIVTGSSCGKIC